MQYEMIRYLIGGIGTTLVNLSIFGILRYGLDMRMQAANILSIIAAILFAFIVNKNLYSAQTTPDQCGKNFCGLQECAESLLPWKYSECRY